MGPAFFRLVGARRDCIGVAHDRHSRLFNCEMISEKLQGSDTSCRRELPVVSEPSIPNRSRVSMAFQPHGIRNKFYGCRKFCDNSKPVLIYGVIAGGKEGTLFQTND